MEGRGQEEGAETASQVSSLFLLNYYLGVKREDNYYNFCYIYIFVLCVYIYIFHFIGCVFYSLW